MKGILGIIYICIGMYGFGEVISTPDTQLVLAFCAGVTIGYGVTMVIEESRR